MKVLFVCLGNTARSQMAAAFYNQLTQTKDADSAGIHVEKPGQTLQERKKERPGRSFVVDAMHEIGIDVSSAVSTQLTKEMLSQYESVINMAGKRFTPKWLAEAPNYTYWQVDDPRGRNHEVTVRARDAVKQRVIRLVTPSNKR